MTKLDCLPRQNNLLCNSCGAKNATGTRICHSCGERLLDFNPTDMNGTKK